MNTHDDADVDTRRLQSVLGQLEDDCWRWSYNEHEGDHEAAVSYRENTLKLLSEARKEWRQIEREILKRAKAEGL